MAGKKIDIVDYIMQEWGIERAQVLEYFELAKKEWTRYLAG